MISSILFTFLKEGYDEKILSANCQTKPNASEVLRRCRYARLESIGVMAKHERTGYLSLFVFLARIVVYWKHYVISHENFYG